MSKAPDRLATLCWLVLAAIHASPAAAFFRPALLDSLYGVPPEGPAGVLLIHRGALFLSVVIVAAFAAFSPEARKAASLLVGTSVTSFLIVYAGAGAPGGALRTIALVDAGALPPLALVCRDAWRRG